MYLRYILTVLAILTAAIISVPDARAQSRTPACLEASGGSCGLERLVTGRRTPMARAKFAEPTQLNYFRSIMVLVITP